MVVIGAGLAGLVVAGRLAERGVSVVVVDRKADPSAHVHTTGIFVRKTLEDFDLPEDCLGPVVRDVRLMSPAGRGMTITSRHDEFRVGRMSRLYRRMLGECQRAGVVVLAGTRYLSSRPVACGSVVRLDHGGHQIDITSRLLIGADGARSRVARDLGLDRNTRWIVGVEDVLPVSSAGPRRGGTNPCFECHLDPRVAPGYLAWVVDDGEEVHVGVGGYASRFNAASALEEFRRRVGINAEGGGRRERRGGLIPVNGVLGRIGCPRGLLVGDAAGAVSPLTAGGLDPAIRLSVHAAGVAAELLAGNDRALARYRGEVFGARFISRRWMRAGLDAVSSVVAMEAACWCMRTPVGRVVARHVFFGRGGSFPEPDRAIAAANRRSVPVYV
ncbi:MAG: NAD(P)/FAD-dependent oxidoreductase [Phycisphaerales bacterium]|nr:NAD(P)/FAD-dependent oxidoreductase [Phycisphaerales bacterium]